MSKGKKVVYGLFIPVVIIVAWYFYTTYSNVPDSLLPKIHASIGLSMYVAFNPNARSNGTSYSNEEYKNQRFCITSSSTVPGARFIFSFSVVSMTYPIQPYLSGYSSNDTLLSAINRFPLLSNLL